MPKGERSGALPFPLDSFGSRSRSQTNEDGIIACIFDRIAPLRRDFVEFGIGPNWKDDNYSKGLEGNCVLLKEQGWSGLFLDGREHPPQYNVEKQFITPMNVNGIFRAHNVPFDVDIVSIDLDGQDFWVWLALQWRPTLYIVEFNPNFASLDAAVTVPYDEAFRWDGSKFYGASLGAMLCLGRQKGYTLVYANGVNAFFVRDDLLLNRAEFDAERINRSHSQHRDDAARRAWQRVNVL